MLNPFRVLKKSTLHTVPSQKYAQLEMELNALHSSQAIIEFDLDGTVITANENFLSLMGYQMDALEGKNHRIFMHPDDAAHADYDDFWKALNQGKFINKLCRRISNDGREVWLQACYSPVVDSDGTPFKIIKISTDITQQQLEIADLKSQAKAIKRSQAVIEFGLDGMILWANENFLNAVGYDLNEVQGKHHRIFVDQEEQLSDQYAEFWKSLVRGEFVADQFSRRKKNGDILWLQASYNPILDPSGKPVKVIKYATDITNQKSREQELRTMLSEATNVMSAMSTGDLTQRMLGSYENKLDTLSKAINSTVVQLDSMISNVISGTTQLQAGSCSLVELNTLSHDAAQDAADQTQRSSETVSLISNSVDGVAQTLSELVTAIRDISENSAEAVNIAKEAVGIFKHAQTNVHQLAESSNDIGAVIKVINSIADQTNLLALNATIEAARAGDAGKGFAVVANEVKELAKETAKATEEISQKISKIQNDSEATGKIITDISSIFETISSRQVAIATTIEQQLVASSQISLSINETSEGAADIARGISITADVAQNNLQRAEQSQATAKNISTLSDSLKQIASQFKLAHTQSHKNRAP